MKNNFYGSKLNTVLLLILIVLVIFALRFIYQNQGEYVPLSENDNNSVATSLLNKNLNEDEVLELFFKYLSEKKYSDAVYFYDGSYESLRGWNSLVPKDDLETLWKNACEINGLHCLPILKVVKKEKLIPKEVFSKDALLEWREKENKYNIVYEYTVNYQNQDGTVFETGPCCGQEDTGVRIKDFKVLVAGNGENFFVLNAPEYTP